MGYVVDNSIVADNVDFAGDIFYVLQYLVSQAKSTFHCIIFLAEISYFLTVRKIIRFDFADELKIGCLRYICICIFVFVFVYFTTTKGHNKMHWHGGDSLRKDCLLLLIEGRAVLSCKRSHKTQR